MIKYIKFNFKKKKILFLCSIIIVFIGTILIVKNYKSNRASVVGGILQEGIIPGYTEEQIKEILQRKADESTFSFEINSRPIFKDGKSEGNLRIANPPYNKYLIKVERLKAGEYNATATINAYDIESGEYKGTSAAKLIIKIES